MQVGEGEWGGRKREKRKGRNRIIKQQIMILGWPKNTGSKGTEEELAYCSDFYIGQTPQYGI